jgi:hypothetical protein
MIDIAHDFEVAQPVVSFPAVDVVDVFPCGEPSTEMLFHDAAMLVNLLPVLADHTVSGGVQTVLEHASIVAMAATEPLSRATFVFEELDTAERAMDRYFHGVSNIPCPSAFGNIRRYGLAGLMAGGGAAAGLQTPSGGDQP